MRDKGSGQLNLCPGELNCDRFQSARGENRQQKEKNACTGCELLSSKLNPKAEESERYLDYLVGYAMQMRIEKKVGETHDPTAIEHKTLVLVEKWFDSYERRLNLENSKMLELVLSRPML